MKKILGIGNAIVDVLCKSDDQFLSENGLIKNSMTLIDDATSTKLSELKSENITSGGSVGNSIAALAQLGVKSAFLGKIGNDFFGEKFVSELQKSSAEFLGDKNHHQNTARSFVLVTPDAKRTMCTFLGCASQITENDIDESCFRDLSVLYLEGYLWDAPTTISALKKAIKLAKKNGAKVAFSLSDSFCVARHKTDFLELIKNDLDLLFANEHEALELDENFKKLFAQNPNLTAVVTKSEKGCEVFSAQKSFALAAEPITNLVDTTGAGDAFAAGFLYGLVNNFTLEKSAHTGNILAAKIIQKFGARFDDSEIKSLKL